ncbi:N-acetylmuramidase family protein [Caballeronia sp. SEWSISQ10-4 2]|uniref:N-acetylmuramidase family protein n=1 Tax=Caballeronia sp. SEWSISQ10-4 2 TaxID=2937438 RepID=UPI0026552197|nr:N-acetylmuramidase family protein [Caballeronia sp. SEWSISQ10-4 2]MDN7179121.1 N-acetylmuramidase family protein [Caballeronia sp. SEWSISQ10-4 2]
MTVTTLTLDDYKKAAADLGVSVAAVRAVASVETKGAGFLPDGVRPVILFERHIMRRQLVSNGLPGDAQHFAMTQPDIVNATPGGYSNKAGEWDRLARAITIHRPSAIESASWGIFQIMGFHWKLMGYASAQAFLNAMYSGAGAHLDAFIRFVKANPNLIRALRALDFAAFASGYNGKDYAINKYDTKMRDAFITYSKEQAA